MTRALYRKYRSKTLGDIVGQHHVTDVLQKSLAQGRVAHAYLLTGPKGVGKTSIARILAHEINKLPYSDDTQHLDIIEIDAASNNGVEDIRDLRDKVQIAPVSAAKKVYIIDEVHMLSKAAFNALLKTLEEPPDHIVFILATTDIEKLPPTIISRTQRFSFRSISVTDAVKHLTHIAKEEKIKIDADALELIASRGGGSFRDSISLLDQLSSLAGKGESITRELVEESLGLAPNEEVTKLLEAYESKDLSAIISLLNSSEAAGVQAGVLTDQLILAIRGQLFEKPHLLGLLDTLLEVPKSSQPSIKLLTVLAAHTTRPRNAALSAPAPSIVASVEELRNVPPSAQRVSSRSSPTINKHLQPEQLPDGSQGAPGAKPFENGGARESDKNNKKVKEPHPLIELDWQKLVDYTRKHHVAIYSVLAKCSHEMDGAMLIIYTNNAFYKKKLDDTKYRVDIIKSLVEIGVGELEIETIPTPPPPKDSVAASVAAIMGGGEEVSVGEATTS